MRVFNEDMATRELKIMSVKEKVELTKRDLAEQVDKTEIRVISKRKAEFLD